MWFLNIETLNTSTPDMSLIKVDKWMDANVLGPNDVSHQIYDPTGHNMMITTWRQTDGAGSLLFLNADTNVVEKSIKMPPSPHSLAYPGFNR